MRKLTYTKAATCGENLKARVTLEQSEKMQLAWFAAGKTWNYGSKEISCTDKPFLFLNDVLTMSSDSFWFENNINNEIELIDDQQHDFASQQDVLAYICDSKNKVIHSVVGLIVSFKAGKLWDFKNDEEFEGDFFTRPENWRKHTPPRLIRVNGVEVPAPLDGLEKVDVVYIAVPTHPEKYLAVQNKTYSDSQMLQWLRDGLCYAIKEDAIARAEAMQIFEVVE